MRRVVCTTEAETLALGEALAQELAPHGVLLLEGPLGAGKTVLAKGVARGLGIDPATVQSPTFTIVADHRGPGGALVHCDLYRLEPAEVLAAGIDEVIGGSGVAVVEWPERLEGGWPGAMLAKIRVAPGSNDRIVEIFASAVD